MGRLSTTECTYLPTYLPTCVCRLCCLWWLVLLVPGVAVFCWGSAGGPGCPALSFGGPCQLWCPCLVWPSLGVFPVVSCSPVLCPYQKKVPTRTVRKSAFPML